MIQRVNEKRLIQLVCELTKRTRDEIEQTGLKPDDFLGIANKYEVALYWEELPLDNPGYYSKDECKIVLNNRIKNQERLNFTFYHELTHHLIEHNDEILTLLADAYISSDYETMERLCNAGAAELLMPSEDVRQLMLEKGFSTTLIPELCERFGASSIAVAFQMVNCASHDCYLVIAENQIVQPTAVHNQTPLLNIKSINVPQEQLVIIYSGASPVAKYSIKRNQTLSNNHLLCESLHANEPVRGDAKLPFASGNGWDVPCEALYFRGKVFAFFNRTQPMSNLQMSLF